MASAKSTSTSASASKSSAALVDTKTRDYLEEDPEIRGQRYVCLSFLSPEEVIQRKEIVFFGKFLAPFGAELNTLFDNIKAKFDGNQEVVEMVAGLRHRYDYLFDAKALGEEYEYYKQKNSETLEKEYLEANDFQTSIRGIKVRGAYDTVPEARNRAEFLKKRDPAFDVYVGQVGCWCPWSANPEDIADAEYSEAALNTLMKKYKENQQEKEEHFRMRRDEMMKQNELTNKSKKDAAAAAGPSVSATVVELPDDEPASPASFFEKEDPKPPSRA
jgi:hypothetical protein